MRLGLLVVACSSLLACSAGKSRGTGATSDPDGGAEDPGDLSLASADLAARFMGVVYAHSSSDLYKVDPDTLAVTHVGAFKFTGSASDELTDIALDVDGNMVGVSFGAVYSIDKSTAACKRLSSISQSFNGLSFIPPDQVDQNGGGTEILVAVDLNGDLTQIDPKTGKTTHLGNYGNGYVSSGDIVSVEGLGAYATVSGGFGGTDSLARIDPAHGGKATIIGDTGYSDLWGLGFWKDKLFGFSEGGDFVTLDVKTGKATRIQSGGQAWWGAGVTTSAPVMIQ